MNTKIPVIITVQKQSIGSGNGYNLVHNQEPGWRNSLGHCFIGTKKSKQDAYISASRIMDKYNKLEEPTK
jgi:hypothetical protein